MGNPHTTGSSKSHGLLARSWTLSLFRDCWPHMTFGSVLRCRDYLVRERAGQLGEAAMLNLDLSAPHSSRLTLRERGSDFYTFWDIFVNGVYRNALMEGRDALTIVDLGANVGIAALWFAKQFAHASIVCVEPHPSNYSLLTDNVAALVAKGRCRTIRAAVWDKAGVLQANQALDNDHYSAFSVTEESKSGEPQRFPGMTVDQIVDASRFSTVDLIKIDVEGAEARLFHNSGWLSRVRAIAIEFHGASRQESNFDAVVTAAGFDIFDDEAHTIWAVKRREQSDPHEQPSWSRSSS